MNNTKDRKLTKEGEFVVDFLIKSYGITNFGQKALETYEDLFKKYHPVINEEQYDENGELNDDAIPF
jgi:diketogulonate reductase-like aldo/keto reductase